MKFNSHKRPCVGNICTEFMNRILTLRASFLTREANFLDIQLTTELKFFVALTYCREEFGKFGTFLTSKKCRNWTVFW